MYFIEHMFVTNGKVTYVSVLNRDTFAWEKTKLWNIAHGCGLGKKEEREDHTVSQNSIYWSWTQWNFVQIQINFKFTIQNFIM